MNIYTHINAYKCKLYRKEDNYLYIYIYRSCKDYTKLENEYF